MTQTIEAPAIAPASGHSRRLPLACAYGIEVLTSISCNLLINGIAFYTTERFDWTTSQNLLLMMAQGAVYAAGALSAGGLAARFSKSRLLLVVNAILLLMVVAMFFTSSLWGIISILLLYSYVSTLTWPLVESIVTEGCDPVRMNRRITLYNLGWSTVCVGVIAVYGTILEYWQAGPMIIPIVCHALGVVAAATMVATHRPSASAGGHEMHADPEVALRLSAQRRLALWLSRLSLPAVFVIANSVMGIFPNFAIARELGIIWSTVLAAIWMGSRSITFIVLGATSWWHTRPRLLLACGVAMLLSFLVITLPGERMGIFADAPLWVAVLLITVGELVLGIAAGFIFSASLYFGMVLSDGSAEHGGYHEALIGAGMVLGPGLAAGAQMLSTQSTGMPAIVAVTALMLATLTCAFGVSARNRSR